MASRCAWLGACANAAVANIAATVSNGASFVARFNVLIISINPFVVAGSRRLNRSKISNVTAVKISSGPHHFRFPVSLQADCCYFYGMAESRFFSKGLFQNKKRIGARKMKASRSPAHFRPNSAAGQKALAVCRAAFAVAAFGVLSGCEQNTFVPPPPPKGDVAVPAQGSFTRYLEATGNTAPVKSVDLVARVQ